MSMSEQKPWKGREEGEADTGYQGLAQIHANSLLPKKRSRNHPLSKQQRKENREISRKRRHGRKFCVSENRQSQEWW